MLQRTIDRLIGRKPRRKTLMWVQDHLPDARLPSFAESRRALNVGVGMNSPLWPTFIAAAGAGAAFWWWTQWARGRAETEAREAAAIVEGEQHPNTVMAHAAEPAHTGAEPADPSDSDLVEPAEVLMAHSPSQGGLSESGEAAKPRTPRKRKAPTVPTVTH